MRTLILLISFVAMATVSLASDWPKFLGNAGNGTSDETGFLREFPDSGPPLLWTAKMEPGYGGASVRDGEVYIMDRVQGQKDVLRVLDLKNGQELWRFEFEVPGRLMYPGSRCVPTVEEDLVYAMGGFGHLYCINRESREAEWIVNVLEEFGGDQPMFGYAVSPLVVGDLVVIAPLGEEVGLVALDRFTADRVWSCEGLGSSHSTPALLELQGEEQILFLSSRIDMSVFGGGPPGGSSDGSGPPTPPTPPPSAPTPGSTPPQESEVPENFADFKIPGTGQITALSPEGDVLWESDLYYCSTPIPVPIKIDDEHFFVTGGYDAGSVLLRLAQGDDGYQVEEVFRHVKGGQIHVPLRVGNHLYLLVNENSNDPRPRRKNGGLMCIDLEGNVQWRTGEDPYFGRGSMILADDMLIIQDGRSGYLRLVEPTPKGYKLIAEHNVFGKDQRRDHRIWSPMALTDGHLLMRSQEELKCLQLKKVASTP